MAEKIVGKSLHLEFELGPAKWNYAVLEGGKLVLSRMTYPRDYETIILDSSTGPTKYGSITLNNQSGHTRVYLEGSDVAKCILGGEGGTGFLKIENAEDETGAVISGNDGGLYLQNDSGTTTVKFTGTDGHGKLRSLEVSGNLEVGNALEVDGALEVTGHGNFNHIHVGISDNQSRIDLIGSNGLISSRALNIENDSGEVSTALKDNRLDIGLSGKPGQIGVYNEEGSETVRIDGDSGDIILQNADCAEEFDIADHNVEPGSVVVFGKDGLLYPSTEAYDKRVAGVISGAGTYKPGLILDRKPNSINRKPIALVGKVYCKVDANHASIEAGDLLTTADTPGHAMKAVDTMRAPGCIIGKALEPLRSGTAMIPILVTLQ